MSECNHQVGEITGKDWPGINSSNIVKSLAFKAIRKPGIYMETNVYTYSWQWLTAIKLKLEKKE